MKRPLTIDRFYKYFLNSFSPGKNTSLGFFDILDWEDLKQNEAECRNYQRKDFFKIALLDGKGIYSFQNKKVEVGGKSIVFVNPRTRASFETLDENFKGEYCVFSENFLNNSSRINLWSLPVFTPGEIYIYSLEKDTYEELFQIMQQLKLEFKSSYAFKEQLITNRLFDLIHYTQKLSADAPDAGANNPNRSLTDRFLTMLDNQFLSVRKDHPLQLRSPNDFAKNLGTTVASLNRNLKTYLGKTTSTVIRDRIIQEANIILLHSNWGIKQIAWALNFKEDSHFINYYKKYTGSTPQEFRTSNKSLQ